MFRALAEHEGALARFTIRRSGTFRDRSGPFADRRGRRSEHARARVLPGPQANFHREGYEEHEGEKNEINLKDSNSIGLFIFALFAPFVVKILPLKN